MDKCNYVLGHSFVISFVKTMSVEDLSELKGNISKILIYKKKCKDEKQKLKKINYPCVV